MRDVDDVNDVLEGYSVGNVKLGMEEGDFQFLI
jgi:hypothetical protein